MTVKMAHIRHQGIDFAVFSADARVATTSARQRLLGQLVAAARNSGLRVQKAALSFLRHGKHQFWGTPDLVKLLAGSGVPRWTHEIRV